MDCRHIFKRTGPAAPGKMYVECRNCGTTTVAADPTVTRDQFPLLTSFLS